MKPAVELNAVKRKLNEVASAGSRLTGFKAALAALDSTTPDDDGLDAWVARRAALGVLVDSAQRTLEAAKASLVSAEAAASEKDARARHEALKRKAEADGKLVLQIGLYSRKLAALLGELDASNAQVAAAMADPAIRRLGFIPDAERLLREKPGHEVAEILGEVEVWHDANGRRPTEIRMRDGQAFGKDGSPLRRAKESYVVRRADFVPASMPTRFADAIKLYDLAGKPLWARDTD